MRTPPKASAGGDTEVFESVHAIGNVLHPTSRRCLAIVRCNNQERERLRSNKQLSHLKRMCLLSSASSELARRRAPFEFGWVDVKLISTGQANVARSRLQIHSRNFSRSLSHCPKRGAPVVFEEPSVMRFEDVRVFEGGKNTIAWLLALCSCVIAIPLRSTLQGR